VLHNLKSPSFGRLGLRCGLPHTGATALGLEGIKPAEKIEGGFQELRRRNQELLDKGAEAFENSDILKALREKSDANKETRVSILCSLCTELAICFAL